MTIKILVKHARSGGRARAAKLSPERRSEIARLGGLARQAKRRDCQHLDFDDTLSGKRCGQCGVEANETAGN